PIRERRTPTLLALKPARVVGHCRGRRFRMNCETLGPEYFILGRISCALRVRGGSCFRASQPVRQRSRMLILARAVTYLVLHTSVGEVLEPEVPLHPCHQFCSG